MTNDFRRMFSLALALTYLLCLLCRDSSIPIVIFFILYLIEYQVGYVEKM